jgi:hypothetical protein
VLGEIVPDGVLHEAFERPLALGGDRLYPYVLDEFRPHFTLTNAIAEADRVARLLQQEFRLRVASPALRVDALTLFGEGEPGGAFRILRRFPLGGPKRTRRSPARAFAPALLD